MLCEVYDNILSEQQEDECWSSSLSMIATIVVYHQLQVQFCMIFSH